MALRAGRQIVSSALRYSAVTHRRQIPVARACAQRAVARYASTDPVQQTPEVPKGQNASPNGDGDEQEDGKPGAIGGFMRGLMGGQAVAAEDAFVAEAKEQGVELPPPPPPRRADLVPVRRRKRREEDTDDEQTIRDRLFSRFGGSAFMKGAFDAKERIAERIDESDNPVINMFRNIYDRFFAENEMAMVIREIREEDEAFTVSEFLRQVEKERIPTILGAYLSGDRELLRASCTEDAYRMLNASIRERDAEGIVMDTNILHIGDIELTAGRVLEDSPVLIVSFNTQQINCLRDRSGEVIEGKEDDIRAVYYIWAFVREVELEEANPTGGGLGGSDRKAEADGNDDADGENTGDHDSSKDDESANSTNTKPWKLLEMVIRGAHSTL